MLLIESHIKNTNMVSTIRSFAQTIRHLPGFRSLNPVWNLLRQPYLKFLVTLAGNNGIMVKVGEQSMRLHPIFATQNWETVEAKSYKAFANAIKLGDVIFDVGAHIGTYTIIALQKSGSQGKVISYEPHNFTRNYLVKHLQWNGVMGRTIIRDICCGKNVGTINFYCLPEQAEGMNGLVPVDGFERQTVNVTTLDQEVQNLGLIPNLIKIDVEGGELEVLQGAELTLEKYKPQLHLSLHPAALSKLNQTPETVMEWLRQKGYKTEIIDIDHEIHVIARG